MPDIRTLLNEAAPTPLAPLDMEAVKARAVRRMRRRLLAVVTVVTALLAAIPIGNTVLAPAGGGDASVIIEPPPAVADPTVEPDRSDQDASGPGEQPHPSGPTDGSASPESPAAQGNAPVPSTFAPTTTAGPAATPTNGYPLAQSCSVDNVGLAYGEQRSCTFTATHAGGWNHYQPADHGPSIGDPATVTVRVVHEGVTQIYRSDAVPDGGPAGSYDVEGCDDAIIQPGDLVEVTIEQPDGRYDPVVGEAGGGAGKGWGCTRQGP